MTMREIPTRKAQKQSSDESHATLEETKIEKSEGTAKIEASAPAAPENPSKKDFSGRYRVREGYLIPHGNFDASGSRHIAKGGDIIHMTHDEALSTIRLTMHQKDANGKPNGPAIETESAYVARVEAQRQADEFARMLNEHNPLLDLTTPNP